jgi:hypothetical protein
MWLFVGFFIAPEAVTLYFVLMLATLTLNTCENYHKNNANIAVILF